MHRAPPKRRSLHLGEPEPRIFALSGPPRQASRPRLGEALLRLGVPASPVLAHLFR